MGEAVGGWKRENVGEKVKKVGNKPVPGLRFVPWATAHRELRGGARDR